MAEKESFLVHIIDELGIGGAQTNLVNFLKATKKYNKIKQAVISIIGDGLFRSEIENLGFQVKVFDFGNAIRSRWPIKEIWELRNFLMELKPTHVLCHLTWSRFLGLPAAWLACVPHRFGYEHGDIYLNSFGIRMGNLISSQLAQQIFVCSQALGHWYHSHQWVFKRLIRPIYFGIDVERILNTSSDRSLRVNWNFGPKTYVFCAAGTMGRGVNKRFDVCIRAIAELIAEGMDVALVLCGDGELRPQLESLAKELNMSQRIKFLGLCKDVFSVMQNCDAFCHATPFEPFGLVIIEAMLMGLPVIVPNSGGPPEIVGHGEFGLLYEALNFKDLSVKMKMLIQNPDLQKKLIQTGRDRVVREYSMDRYVHELFKTMGCMD